MKLNYLQLKIIVILAMTVNHVVVKAAFIVLLLFMSMDWGVFIVIFSLVFAYYPKDRQQQVITYTIQQWAYYCSMMWGGYMPYQP